MISTIGTLLFIYFSNLSINAMESVLLGPFMLGLRYEGLTVVSMRDHQDGKAGWLKYPQTRANLEESNPGLLQLRIFMSSHRELKPRIGEMLQYPMYAATGTAAPSSLPLRNSLHWDSEIFAVRTGMRGPTDAQGRARLPDRMVVHRDAGRYYYYTYIPVVQTGRTCERDLACVAHDFWTNPQTFNIQLGFHVGDIPVKSNVITVPAEDVAAALAAYTK